MRRALRSCVWTVVSTGADRTYLLGIADLNQLELSRKRLLALLEGHQLSRALKQVRRQSVKRWQGWS